jgi:ribonuclease-3
MSENIKTVLEKMEITFKNQSLLLEALTHRSFINEQSEPGDKHNERLEYLGDAVLELIVSELLFNDYQELPEGDLTSFRSALVRTESLADSAREIGLGQDLRMSNGEEISGGRERPYILANGFEALIGAIYIDQGYEVAKRFIQEHIYHKIKNIVENRLDIDSKSKLQEISQEILKITPSYVQINEEGPDHNKTFTMGVQIGEHIFAEGVGESKQMAEQNAAGTALESWDKLIQKFFPPNA